MITLTIGMKVGDLNRIPPGGRPWKGELMAQTDPRAWVGSLAFPSVVYDGTPPQDKVNAHVAWCHSQGLLKDVVPVLWDFGTYRKVWWEPTKDLLPYADVLVQWRANKAA
jgi:hypothetical protein